MREIKKSLRIKNIENKWEKPTEKLLYEWHWKDNLKHKEIGEKLNIPRPTITHWFKRLKIPTQSNTRFTNNNLLNVGPRKGPRKKKVIKTPKKRIPVNEEFFKKWSPEMAYVLGYFAADGYMSLNSRGGCFIGFSSTDLELIEKIKKLIGSEHRIGIRRRKNANWKDAYTLQIGSKKIFNDLLHLNLVPNKSNILKMPEVPKKYFCHFLRGYFDGDGSIFFGKHQRKTRKSPIYIARISFTSGSKQFLEEILRKIRKYNLFEGGGISQKNRGFELRFALYDSLKLYKFMYNNVSNSQFLERKYNVFQEILNHWGRSSVG